MKWMFLSVWTDNEVVFSLQRLGVCGPYLILGQGWLGRFHRRVVFRSSHVVCSARGRRGRLCDAVGRHRDIGNRENPPVGILLFASCHSREPGCGNMADTQLR